MKRTSKLMLGVALLLLVVYGIYDIVKQIRNSYTSGFLYTYSHAIGQMMGPQFDALALRGEGIRIGVIDAGFGEFRSNRFTRNLCVEDYRDLTDNDTTGFFHDACNHGTEVTQNIGGHAGDTLLGLAAGSTYLLVKADLETTEPRADERRLCLALKWLAERQVDVVNISLTYTKFDDFEGYMPEMLDGKTTLCSRFIDSLLKMHPQLVVVLSAGNMGNKEWRYLAFPADVEEVLTVGAVDFDGEKCAAKSSRGFYPYPIKPDLVVYDSPSGTSFSAPVVTGLCAGLLGYERMGRRELIRLLHASSSRSTMPDLETGYGIPRCDSILKLISNKRDRI